MTYQIIFQYFDYGLCLVQANKHLFVEHLIKSHGDKVNSAIDMMYGLHGFVGLCILIAIWAKIDTIFSGTDNVNRIRIVLFGVWIWDVMSDLIFTARAFEQKFHAQGILGLIFVIIPWTANVFILIKSQREWTQMSRWY